VDLIGATGPILSIPAATFEHAGTYQVLVFNSGGQVLSDKAIVTVESVGPRIPVAGMSIRMVPEVTTLGDENTQWSLEWAPSLSPDAPWFALTNFTMTRSGCKVIDLSDAQPGRFYRSIGGYLGVPPSMAVIPEGSFQMGAAIVGVGPVHTVYVSRFLIDRYEVSKDLWDNVRSWAISKNYDLPVGSSFDGPLQPIHSVSWYDAVKWCNARSEKEGINPAYYSDAGLRVVYRAGQIQPYLKKNTGYRLPTEAEWEKAARGGYSDKSYPWPDGFSISPSMANYNDTGLGKTAPVSSYPANGYGVYNISGNVWEWCWDYYGAYSAGNQTDPLGASQGNARVIRGGGWDNADNFCRVFSRISNGNPTSRGNSLGFRTVRSGQ
jgi:formylglycine-generating enzyme required for sulfatase activity